MMMRAALVSAFAIGLAATTPVQAAWGKSYFFDQASIGKVCVVSPPNSLYMHCFFTANRKDSYLITGSTGDVDQGADELAAEFCLAVGFAKDRASKALDVEELPGGDIGGPRVGVRSLYCEDTK